MLKNDCITKTDHQGKQWIGIPKAAVDTDPWLDPADYEQNAKLAWVAVESLEPMNVCNWDLFFQKVSETGSELSQDGFCDVKAITDLIPDSNKDNRLDGKDIKAVLTDEKVKYQLRNFVVEHPSEWYYSDTMNDRKWKRLTTDSSILNRLMKEEDEYPAFLETVRKLSFLDQVNGFTENEKLWYFHPIAFVQHLKRIFDSLDIFQIIAKDLDVEVAAIKAVAHVESRGDGFLPSGHPIILFESHLFRKHTRAQYDTSHPTISHKYRDSNRNIIRNYLGGEREVTERLNVAISLDREAALKSDVVK